LAEAEVARCEHCHRTEIFPMEVYGQETRFWCGWCSNYTELKPGTVLRKLPKGAFSRPRRSAEGELEPSPMEQFMLTRKMSERAEDLVALHRELLDAEEDEWS
jgi:hypothetical protein